MRDAATDSIGAALAVSGRLGGAGVALADAAREAFVYAMSRAALVTAVIALIGAFVAWRFLPARALELAEPMVPDTVLDADDEPDDVGILTTELAEAG